MKNITLLSVIFLILWIWNSFGNAISNEDFTVSTEHMNSKNADLFLIPPLLSGSISGTVTDFVTGSPLLDVQVVATPEVYGAGDPGWVDSSTSDCYMSVYVTSVNTCFGFVMAGKIAVFHSTTNQCRGVTDFFDGGGIGQAIIGVGVGCNEAGTTFYYKVWDSEIDIVYDIIETGVIVLDDFLMVDLNAVTPNFDPVITSTAIDGSYIFEDIPDGRYTVCTGVTVPTQGYLDECTPAPVILPSSAVVNFSLIPLEGGAVIINFPEEFPDACQGDNYIFDFSVVVILNAIEETWAVEPEGAGYFDELIFYLDSEFNGNVTITLIAVSVEPFEVATAAVDFTVFPAPPQPVCPQFDPFCNTDSDIELPLVPEGVYYLYGSAITVFSPSGFGSGIYPIDLVVTNEYGCANGCTFEIIVNQTPVVSCPGDFSNCSGAIVELSGAIPEGGLFVGPGVSGNFFNPAEAGIGEHMISYFNSDFQSGCSDFCIFQITVLPGQVIDITAGWSGLSSYVVPLYPDVAALLSPVIGKLVILYNLAGMYWLELQVNTLGEWDCYSGYVIKTTGNTGLYICGPDAQDKTVSLSPGWNLVPVLSTTPCDIVQLFGTVDGFVVAKEVADGGVYWRSFGINTIGDVLPGKAYFVLMSTPGIIDYSLPGGKSGSALKGNVPLPETPWNEVIPTPVTHLVAYNLPGQVFLSGDVVGGFTPDGRCAGITVVTDPAMPFALSLYGDDLYSTGKDGFATGETISYKLYRQSDGEIFDLVVTCNPAMNTGIFETNGLSEVTSVKMVSTGMKSPAAGQLKLWPNPSQGTFTIEGIECNAHISIFNAYGDEIRKNEMTTLPATINISTQPKGIYFIRVETGDNVFFEKLIIN